jgi:hypothetical protein
MVQHASRGRDPHTRAEALRTGDTAVEAAAEAQAPSSSALTAGFHDAAVIEALDPSVWLELFDAYGAPPGMNPQTATLEHIADRLAATGLPESLQGALEWLYNLGSPDGCERLVSSAGEFNVDLRPLQRGLEPVEFVARFAIMAAADQSARRAIERAQTNALIAGHQASRVHEFRGRALKALIDPEARLMQLRARLIPLFDTQELGDRADVTLRQDAEVTRVIIVRGKRLHAPVSFTESGRRRLPHRPVHCDMIVYDAAANLISIRTSESLVEGYRRIVGEIFWGDAEHLVRSACSLEPLKEGRSMLGRHGCADVRDIRLTYAKFRPHEGGTCEYSDADVFALMSRMRIPVAEGDFVAARFQVSFYGSGRRQMTVEVKPPTVKAADNARKPVLLGALQNIGVWRVGNDATGPFFWELAAGVHSREEWTYVLTAGVVDQLLSAKCLVHGKVPSLHHAGAPGAGRVLDVTETDDDPPFYGESVDEHVPGRLLTSSEVEGLELNAPRLAELWANALGCTGAVRELALPGLFTLGESKFGSKSLHILLALREPRGDIAKLAPTFPSPSVVIAPRSRNAVTWPMPSVRSESMAPDRQALRRAIVREVHLESEVDARDRARSEDTLIVDAATKRVWLHGIQIEIAGAPYIFTMLVAQATQANSIAQKNDLITKLAWKDGAANTAANAKMKAENLMKAQLKAAHVCVPTAIFAAKDGGYVYLGHAFVGE